LVAGESEPFELDVHTTHESQLSSRNMAFYSTFVVRGSARAVVTRTGINTVMGQMADLTASNPKDETLITRELSQFIHLVRAHKHKCCFQILDLDVLFTQTEPSISQIGHKLAGIQLSSPRKVVSIFI
jgi:magnesium-transporting ATPase (P-type)